MRSDENVPGIVYEIPGRFGMGMLILQDRAEFYQRELDYRFGQKLWEVLRKHVGNRTFVITLHRSVHPERDTFFRPCFRATIEARVDYVTYEYVRVPAIVEFSMAELRWHHWQRRVKSAWHILRYGRLDHVYC